MKSLAVLFFLFTIIQPSWGETQKVWVSFGSDVESLAVDKFGERFNVSGSFDGISLAKVDYDALPWLSRMIHREFDRCGGFIVHEDYAEAEAFKLNQGQRILAKRGLFHHYEVSQYQLVRRGLELLQSERIVSVIEQLSEFHNRYYTSDSGVESMEWLREHWDNITSHRNDVETYFWEHSSWPQPSVVLEIEGTKYPKEIIVVGGHGDSIAGWWSPQNRRAPGADDNASGIATMTEIMKTMMELNYRPQRTVKFISYAAEEVGLRGSKEIANSMNDQDKNIIGVLQLDMTNYAGSEWDIVLMSDYTNTEQNLFIGSLLDEYQPDITWGYDRCGYACSDHASWHQAGFPASMPFESRMRERNPNIHSNRDVLERSDAEAQHALKFARLGLSYVIELDR